MRQLILRGLFLWRNFAHAVSTFRRHRNTVLSVKRQQTIALALVPGMTLVLMIIRINYIFTTPEGPEAFCFCLYSPSVSHSFFRQLFIN